jgi:hypothetical protein
VQKRAQTEIDSIVGLDRLPMMEDMKDLAYVRAIVKELSRWFTVLPLGEYQITIGLLTFSPVT